MSGSGAGSRSRWEVVGGAEKGGILARAGCDVASEPLAERLGTGAVVEELELVAERLHFRKLSGLGPASGWVSLRLTTGRELLSPLPVPAALAPAASPAVGRGRRKVLCLHGYGTNPAVMKLGVSRLKPKLGPQYELVYLEGPFNCEDTSNRLTPRGEFLDRFKKSSGGHWRGWFDYAFEPDDGVRTPSVLLNDPAVSSSFVGVEEAVESLRRQLAEKGPADALLGFSQGALLMALLEGLCRAKGEPLPWKLSVVFCGLKVYDERYRHLTLPPLPCPAIVVDDSHAAEGVLPLYSEPFLLSHADGHSFPTTEPRAEEVYAQLAEEMQRRLEAA